MKSQGKNSKEHRHCCSSLLLLMSRLHEEAYMKHTQCQHMSCTHRAGLITVYIDYMCFMYTSSCKRGITGVSVSDDLETLVEVPFCPVCESEVILEVPLEPGPGKTLDSSGSGKSLRTESTPIKHFTYVTSSCRLGNFCWIFSFHASGFRHKCIHVLSFL